ncbi:MAG: hypothetical protein Edafosvirus24_1, partial [Edafosvirus sp.]
MKQTSPNKKSNNSGSKGTQAKAKRPMIKCTDFKTNLFSLTEVDPDNERSKGQYIAYPRYKYGGEESSLVFKTGEITIKQGGFPRIDDYHKTDEDRDYFRLNLDPEQPACKELETMCKQIDKEVLSKKKEILSFMKGNGKEKDKDLSDLFEYSAIVREPEDADVVVEKPSKDKKKSSESVKQKERKMPYIKVKLDIDFTTKDVATKVFMKNEEKELVKCDVSNVNKFGEHLTWQSTAKFIIMANKLWISKNKDTSGKRKFGVTFKCIQIDIVKRNEKSGGGMRNKFADYAFDDEEETETKEAPSKSKGASSDNDDDDDNNNKKTNSKETKPVDKKNSKKNEENSDTESDEDNDKNKKNTKSDKNAGKKNNNSDDEGSDDEGKKNTKGKGGDDSDSGSD